MKQIVAWGRLISDPTRLKIIKLLVTRSMCVCELMEVLRLNQSCISQHLAILRYHNLLKSRRQGKWIVYQIDARAMKLYINEIARFLKGPLSRMKVLKKEHRRLVKLKNRGFLCRKGRI